MSYPNHTPPDHTRPVTSTPLAKDRLSSAKKKRLFVQHGAAGIVSFTVSRLALLVPIQNYRNAAVVTGVCNAEPVHPKGGKGTELARVLSEYALKNICDDVLVKQTSLPVHYQEPIARFVSSFLTAPLHIARVKESVSEQSDVLASYLDNLTVQKCLVMSLHETAACILGDFIFDQGVFSLNLDGHRYEPEINLRLSQFAARLVLTPFELFVKRVAVSSTDNVVESFNEEFSRMKRDVNESGYLKYFASVVFWGIPEAVTMFLEKIMYRQIVDRWPKALTESE